MSAPDPAYDAILYAGHRRCAACGHTAYPADAAWLPMPGHPASMPGGYIVATYPPACDHLGAATFIVDGHALGPDTTWCNALTSSTGAPCRNKAQPGSGYCHHHQRQGAGQ